MPLPFQLDFKNPDYIEVFEWRAERLARIRANPATMPGLFTYYRDNPIDFIEDWGMTFDPRNVGTPKPAALPFILFPRQREWLQWVQEMKSGQTPGITRKSRDMGISWLAVAMSASLCMFSDNMTIGFGSRKEEYVDKNGSPKALFWKARQFIRMLPKELRFGWEARKHSSHMRISFAHTQSTMTGEAGDNIGRGDRTTLYFVDESAHLVHPEEVDAALSATTNCRIDMSSVKGSNTPFADKGRRFPAHRVFTFHWREDPRKDDAWYQKQCEELDPITVAQEIDINENASVEGIVIPAVWVQASLDAHKKLNIKPSGEKRAALDVADEGADLNSFVGAHGNVVTKIRSWSGKGADIFDTVEQAFMECVLGGFDSLDYDSDGLGAGVRGDARILNEKRTAQGYAEIEVNAHRGSAGVIYPEDEIVEGRTNDDFFENFKAQAWWSARLRFRETYRAVVEHKPYDPDMIISISSEAGTEREINQLLMELSQPTYKPSKRGKMMIDKKPEGAKSPNAADAIVIRFAPKDTGQALGILLSR